MRTLTDVNNIDTATTDFPHGRTRNKTAMGSGTSVTEELLGDLITVLEKIKADSGITINHLPDNVTNGYQLLDALLTKFASKTNLDTTSLAVTNNKATYDAYVVSNNNRSTAIESSVTSIFNGLKSMSTKDFWVGTQTQYNAIAKNDDTVYFIIK